MGEAIGLKGAARALSIGPAARKNPKASVVDAAKSVKFWAVPGHRGHRRSGESRNPGNPQGKDRAGYRPFRVPAFAGTTVAYDVIALGRGPGNHVLTRAAQATVIGNPDNRQPKPPSFRRKPESRKSSRKRAGRLSNVLASGFRRNDGFMLRLPWGEGQAITS